MQSSIPGNIILQKEKCNYKKSKVVLEIKLEIVYLF